MAFAGLRLKDEIGRQGLGAMGFSMIAITEPTSKEDTAIAVLKEAVKRGVVLINTATFYGPPGAEGFGANLRLLRSCLKSIDRSAYRLMVKIGVDTGAPVETSGGWSFRLDEAGDVEYALDTLGTDYLDIVIVNCVSASGPIEDSVRAVQKLVDAGKVRYIGLSEATPADIRRAATAVPIACIEQEWSLVSRDLEADIVPVCRDLGIVVIAYSPLGRGLLAGAIHSRDDIPAEDPLAQESPKFAEGNLPANLRLVDSLKALADRKGCTVGQLALAWLHAQAERHGLPAVVPIPGPRASHT
eukprot:TRINITY_DN2318_c0_g1_i1.p1 TRINITY_DN2318_c0_g1~~TRINITY_DN2318_c0_g1_i1.p1  ORF type:complete len:307 (-),score=96.45 TRINITY_DN2318_c0_g1_i1:85-984(-)